MAGESEVGGVAGDAAFAVYHSGRPLLDRLLQFDASIESVNTVRQSIANCNVVGLGKSDCASRDAALQGSSLHAGQRLADVEAEACVERAVVKGSLYQSDSSGIFLVCPKHYSAHQISAYAAALCLGIDGDWPNARNDGTLVKAIAPDDAAFAFGDHAVEPGGGEHRRKQAGGNLWPRIVARKAVRATNRRECVVANLAACRAVFGTAVRMVMFVPGPDGMSNSLPAAEVIPIPGRPGCIRRSLPTGRSMIRS